MLATEEKGASGRNCNSCDCIPYPQRKVLVGEVIWDMLYSLYSMLVCREERLHVLAVIEGRIAQHRSGHRKVGAKTGSCPFMRLGHPAEIVIPEIVFSIVRCDLPWVYWVAAGCLFLATRLSLRKW